MRTRLFFLAILFFFVFTSHAQLARKPHWGAQMEDAVQGDIKGCKVVRVVRGTSLELKLVEGDIIMAMFKTPYTSVDAFTNDFLKLKVNDPIQLTVLRNNKKMTLKGKVTGRPLEKDDNADVIYDQADYRGGLLRVIINKPKQAGKMPGMLFIPGYTCSSIDNLTPDHPYKRIVDAYVDAGYVTLRIEKSGLGDSWNTPPCESCDLKDEVENFEVGLRKLKSLHFVDTNQIIIVGHSMGGIVAPAISARNHVAGVVVYGTTAKSWFEYQLEMYRLQNALGGMNPIEVEQSVVEQYDLNYRFFVKKEKLEDMAKDPAVDSVLRVVWGYDGQGKIYSRNAEYWRQIQDYPHLEHWKKTTAKVLVQYGESDFQAFSRADHEQIVNTVNHFHAGNATLMTYPQTDHYYAKSGTMQDAWDKFNGGQYQVLFDEYNPEVGRTAVEWSNTVLALKKADTGALQWKKRTTEPYPGKQDDITFINRNEGWYVNGYGSIYHTKDGGKSWEKQWEKKGTFFRCIAFLDSLNGFVGTVGTDYFPNVTDTIPLYGTKDGGRTWYPVSYIGPYVKGLCAIDVVKEEYINHGRLDYKYHIYAVGRVGSPANSLISHDGGVTWVSTSMQADCKMLFDIKMRDKNTGWACAATHEDITQSNALILKTTDGGQTWRKVYQSNRPYETTWKASFPSASVGYVTIQSYHPDASVKQQRVAKTTDGGETWTEVNVVEDAGAREFGIGFLDEQHGYLGTMNSGYETLDGGQNWKPIDLGRACNKIRIYRDARGTYGFAIGVQVFALEH